jgi:hypothetical protein
VNEMWSDSNQFLAFYFLWIKVIELDFLMS